MTTGSTIARFTITLSKSVAEPVQVAWNTKDGTAKAGIDYAAASGTAVFSPGETNKDVDVLVYGRAVGTEDRNFFLEMTPPPNAILGESIGECIIYLDTAGNTAVIQVVVPTGPQGAKGDGAYQSWLNLGNTGTEQDFLDSLKQSPEEIAAEVAPLLDMGESPVTAEGTAALSKPDTMKLKALARRVAYVGATKVATVTLADGDNLIGQSDLVGDVVDMGGIGLYPRIMRGDLVVSPKWSVQVDGRLLIKDAVAGDVLYVCQYDALSIQAARNSCAVIKSVTWPEFAGGANRSGAAASDAAFTAANATARSIIIPAGTFKIAGNVDVSACELVFSKGALLDVQAGATLTVGRMQCGLYQAFTGAGSVVLTTNAGKAHPEWFGAARGIDSSPALTKCMAACSPNKITTALVDEYFISDLVWDRRVPAEASPRSAFKPFGPATNGVKLTAGNSVGKNSFPAISGFTGYGMRIVGTSLANIYIPEIQRCGDALVLETSGSDTTLLDTEVTLTAISACTNAVVFVADALGNVMQGNKVYVNFIANCDNAVLFRDNGLATPGPDWDSNQVVTQAIDPTTSRASAVMLKNECSYAINRVVFRVETWAGGLASTGKFIEGRFNDLDAYINLAQNPVAGQLDYVGASNRVDFSSARGRNVTPVKAVNASNSMPSFNGGVPLFHNIVKLKYIPSADWANNTQKQAYIYHQLTDQNTNAFTVQPPDSGSLRGTTVDSVIDNSLTTPYEIQINLRNVSGATITAGTEIEFKLRVGLY